MIYRQSCLLTLGLVFLLILPLQTGQDGILPLFICLLALPLWQLVEKDGPSVAWVTLLACFIFWFVAWAIFHLAIAMPSASYWRQQVAYQQVLSIPFRSFLTLLIVTASGTILAWVCVQKGKVIKAKKRYRLLPWLGLFFVVTLLISNITTQKISHFWGISVDVGTWYFPVTYIFNDIFTEVYGYQRTRQYIWAALGANTLAVICFWVALQLSHAPSLAAYQVILGTVPRIFLASTCSFFCGEFFNAFILAKSKIWLKGRWLPARTIGSTMFGVAIDTLVFTCIAFFGTLSLQELATVAGWEYGLKVGYEILATPITMLVIMLLKRFEQEDYYDMQTSFNPFRF